MIEQEITIVLAGEIDNLIPKELVDDKTISIIYCKLDVIELLRMAESLGDVSYVLLLPATNLGLKLCSVIHRRHPNVPVVLAGESQDRELLLYSAQIGCLDFITKDDDYRIIKERLSVCIRLHTVSNKLKAAEKMMQKRGA